jgi:hypothetical protein
VVPAEDAPLRRRRPTDGRALRSRRWRPRWCGLGIPVAALRLAPVVGSHVPTRWGGSCARLVPVPAWPTPPSSSSPRRMRPGRWSRR